VKFGAEVAGRHETMDTTANDYTLAEYTMVGGIKKKKKKKVKRKVTPA